MGGTADKTLSETDGICQDGGCGEGGKAKDGTGAQQEMDGVDDRFDGTSRNGLDLVEQKMQRSRGKVWAGGDKKRLQSEIAGPI